MSPRNQPWKSDQLLLPVVFFFEGCITTWLFLSLFLVYPIFFAASFLGTLGPVGRWPGLGWNHQIKVDEELPPPTERSRVETVHRSARVHCECLGWPCFCRGDDWHHAHYKKQNEGWAEFLCENICEGKAVSTSWKKASHASRTPLLRWPAGFVLIFCAAVSIYCDAFADVIGLFGACFGTLICIIWPLRRESFMVLPVSSVFDCLKMFKIYRGSLSREDCAWLYLTAHIFRFIKKNRLISCVAGSMLTTSFAHSSTQIKRSYLLLNYTFCLCLLVCPPNHHPIIVFFLAMSAKRW